MTHWLIIATLAFDLAAIRTDPNLERRSDRALMNADEAMDAAVKAYEAGDVKKSAENLDELRQSVDLSERSLEETGKDARHHPGPYKRAELKTRALLRRLEQWAHDVGSEDRAMVESARDHVAQVHDGLLEDIMSKKK